MVCMGFPAVHLSQALGGFRHSRMTDLTAIPTRRTVVPIDTSTIAPNNAETPTTKRLATDPPAKLNPKMNPTERKATYPSTTLRTSLRFRVIVAGSAAM